MEFVTGIFDNATAAGSAMEELLSLGISREHVGVLRPGMSDKEVSRSVPVTDSEGPGMGKAMGATVGSAIGAAGGATLGAAAASLAVPGVGPIVAIGLIAAAFAGIAGGVTGAVAGEELEEALGEGLPHEDLYLYEEALRRGYSVVVAFANEGEQADRARDVMKRNGTEDPEQLREDWWSKQRDQERNFYETNGRDFEGDELSYRRGFQAALHPRRRGQSYAQAESELRRDYDDKELDTAFRHGYERGLRYQIHVVEIYKV